MTPDYEYDTTAEYITGLDSLAVSLNCIGDCCFIRQLDLSLNRG